MDSNWSFAPSPGRGEGRREERSIDPLDLPESLREDREGSGQSSQDRGTDASQPETSNNDRPRERKKVGWFAGGDIQDPLQSSAPGGPPLTNDENQAPRQENAGEHETRAISEEALSRQIHEAFGQPFVPKPKPALQRGSPPDGQSWDETSDNGLHNAESTEKNSRSAQSAQERAQKLAERVESYSASRKNSPELSPRTTNESSNGPDRKLVRTENIPLQDLLLQKADTVDDDETEEENDPEEPSGRRPVNTKDAYRLVRSHVRVLDDAYRDHYSNLRSGQVTPIEERPSAFDYVPRPQQYRGGILGSLLKLYRPREQGAGRPSSRQHYHSGFGGNRSADDTPATSPGVSPDVSPPSSGATTPNKRPKWYQRSTSQSSASLAHLLGSSSKFAGSVQHQVGEKLTEQVKSTGRRSKRKGSEGFDKLQRLGRPRPEDEIRITVHIAEIIARQRYLTKLCRALMQYGAPTHRLEEYLKMSARALEINSQFLYIPGCMIISFDDSDTHTTEVRLIRQAQGVDLGKLRDVHEIYKDVVHDVIGVEEAKQRLKEVVTRKQKHSRVALILVYGLASASVGPFAFNARLIDTPIAFVLGCILGFLQLYIAPKSDLYSNVFEIAATVLTSFLSRAFGSISGGSVFCFSALAQSSIALILPGYTVLCASLELQSKNMVAGSVRMVYAIIYSLFLGYGITLGTAIYGIIDRNATSEHTCRDPMPQYWWFFFVPAFTMCLIVINQGKWRQAPVMMAIAFTGYIVTFFSSKQFHGNTQVSNTLGALAIGCMANLYSRIGSQFENWFMAECDKLKERLRRRRLNIGARDTEDPQSTEPGNHKYGYGLAAAAMLPAIFVQVPSGLAVSGSLVSGITSANLITGNTTEGPETVVSNASSVLQGTSAVNNVAFAVSYSVVQVAIGITVGLFLSAVIVYPFGKRRSGPSGLFSF